MTETDNPVVKKHLELKDSQILKRIEELDDNERDFQKMFESREVKPTINMGYYSLDQKKYILGTPQDQGMSIGVNSTSAQALVVTIPDGQIWEIYGMAQTNASRSHNGIFRYSTDGGTTLYPIPGIITQAAATSLASAVTVAPKLILTGSSTNVVITFYDTAFQAADPIKRMYTYRRLK